MALDKSAKNSVTNWRQEFTKSKHSTGSERAHRLMTNTP